MKKLFLLLIFSSFLFADHTLNIYENITFIKDPSDIEKFFPKTIDEVENEKTSTIESFNKQIHSLVNETTYTFDNTARLFDLAFGILHNKTALLEMLSLTYQDKNIREKASNSLVEIVNTSTSSIYNNPKIYDEFVSIDQKKLTPEHKYYVQETKKELESMGLSYPLEKRKKIIALTKEIVNLSEKFSNNIKESSPTFTVSLEELKGMDHDFIRSLKKDEKGNYILNTDYPIAFPIFSHCQVESTRKKMYQAFNKRGFPENIELLKQISKKRHKLANMLGYDSYADMELDNQMVKSSKNAKKFLNDLTKKIAPKQSYEFEILKENLPEGVVLNKKGQINPWDLEFTISSYMKNHFDVDQNEIKKYFPLEKTISGMLGIYEAFFAIKIEQIPNIKLWDKKVRLLKLTKKDSAILLGYIILDLFPRKGKFNHACAIPLLPSLKLNNKDIPSLCVVICNFPEGTDDYPSLMTLGDVNTFFHEFGHALHHTFGRTDLLLNAGLNTKLDFVELPSQLFEQWLDNKEILKLCSGHYKTNEKIPDELINKILESKTAFSGIHYMRQLMFSNYSLSIFSYPCDNIDSLWKKNKKHYIPNVSQSDYDYGYLSFGHLIGYGSRYYGYLWSKVFALDIFEKIEQQGLLNPDAGLLLVENILGKGGSLDPNILLYNYLKRKPNQKAFLKSIDIDKK